MEPSKLLVEYLPLADLLPYARNSRTHDDAQIGQIAASIREFGFTNPVLISTGNDIIAGHGRTMAAAKLGMTEVPCIRLGHLSDTQRRAYVIADNRLAMNAGWDTKMLEVELQELQAEAFELALLGFEQKELEALLNPEQEPGEGLTDPDAVPENVETRCKPGDLWTLGKHRLLCGDSTNVQHVERLMGGEKADCVFTDPPYNIGFVPPRGTHGAIANDDMSPEKFGDFLRAAMTCARIATKDPGYSFVWSGWSTLDQFAPVLREFYTIKALPVWVKNNFGIGYYSRPKYEPFFLCLRGEPQRPAVAPADVWEHAKVYDTLHSCEKPVGLIEDILGAYVGRCSVLDLFLGSGSTLIACEKTGRRCFGMELDPHYCSVILARWEAFTGQQAKLEAFADG